jgi:hypothetical protein
MRVLSSGLCVCVAATSLLAQDSWSLASPTTSPSGRGDTALAYDSARQVVVLFGGGIKNDTWEWDGRTWTERKPKTLPEVHGRHVLAYDSYRKVTVMFGDVR